MNNFSYPTKDEVKEEFMRNCRKDYITYFENFLKKYFKTTIARSTGGQFRKIGIRPQLNKDIFDPKASIYRGVVGMVDNIVRGEKKYILNTICSNKHTERSIDIEFLNGLFGEEFVLFVEPEIKSEWLMRGDVYFDQYLSKFVVYPNSNITVVSIPLSKYDINYSKILFAKNDLLLLHNLQDDEEYLHITIEEGEKYDVTLWTLLKCEIEDQAKIYVE